MALKQTFTDQYGQTHEEAYIRVIETNLNFLSKEAKATVAIYVSEAAREANAKPIDFVELSFPIAPDVDRNGKEIKPGVEFDDVFAAETDPRISIYTYIKTLEQFEEATNA